MSKYLGETSVPGVVALLGEYGLGFGEPALAVAIDHRVSIKAFSTDFDFTIVDDYKMDPVRHRIINAAVKQNWNKETLEFITTSELPFVSGLGTDSALSVATIGLLLGLNNQSSSKKKTKQNQVRTTKQLKAVVLQAFELEKKLDEHRTPIKVTGAAYGGAIYIDDISKDAICSIPNISQNLQGKAKGSSSWNVHTISCNDELSLVVGYQKQKLGFSKHQPKALFSKPIKKSSTSVNSETIPKKLHRLVSRSGLAKDNLRDIGNLTRAGCKAFIGGDFTKLGELMNKEQNLITMLGLCPTELRTIIDIARENSVGVRMTGSTGDSVLSISCDPDRVINNIKNAGFDAIKVNISHEGLIPKLEK